MVIRLSFKGLLLLASAAPGTSACKTMISVNNPANNLLLVIAFSLLLTYSINAPVTVDSFRSPLLSNGLGAFAVFAYASVDFLALSGSMWIQAMVHRRSFFLSNSSPEDRSILLFRATK